MSDSPVRPRVTFLLLTYNQEAYVTEAVRSALTQTYSPIEIIISDDCSEDGTFACVARVLQEHGDRRALLRQNDRNLGLAAHVNRLFELASGEIIVIAAGDDISLPERVEKTVALFDRYPNAQEVLLSVDLIDADSNVIGENILTSGSESIQNFTTLVRGRAKTIGATRAVRRELFDAFGPLSAGCPTEDTTLSVRSLLRGTSVLSGEKGAKYRVHRDNLGSPTSVSKMNIDRIYVQHLQDFARGHERHPWSASETVDFYSWLSRSRRVRALSLREGHVPGIEILRDILWVLFRSALPLRRRLKLVHQVAWRSNKFARPRP